MTVVALRGLREAPKADQSRMETAIVDLDQAKAWRLPGFQRPLRVNQKVVAMAEEMKANAVEISGVITLGQVKGDQTVYLVDGQHRREAFLLSGLKEIIADLRLCRFDTMADMAEEFVRLNSAIVRMNPDDILRGLEETSPPLQTIRRDCPFVGYDNVRRNATNAPVVSMSALLRTWAGSAGDTPSATGGGQNSAAGMAQTLTVDSAEQLVRFLKVAYAAWGRDESNFRLWGNLNMTLSMWLWRKLVVDRERGVRRYVVLNMDQFKKCLMAASASADYVDWLAGRVMRERDRSPCYARLKAVFLQRLKTEMHGQTRLSLPQPPWGSS